MGRRVFVVSGSRQFPNRYQVEIVLWETLRATDVVIVGGAPGVDDWAEQGARALGCRVEVMKADWATYGKAAGYRRNIAMLERLNKAREMGWETGVMAFWDLESRGTRQCIDEAEKRDLDVYVIEPLARDRREVLAERA